MITIVIFGAAVRPDGEPSTVLRRRVEAALACAQSSPCARFIPTGAVGRHGPSEASVMARLLAESGIAKERIILEETGTDTWSSVRAVHHVLRLNPSPGHVLVATSAYHIPRCVVLMRLLGIAARPCPIPPESGSWKKRWYWRLREVPALPYDVILAVWARLIGLFSPDPPKK